ncbi:DUF5753 domain-containing protein [Streptosporangium sp. OZ121]|uniref:DUF5753 domain-containing protein n=1 Tax=Streptosporangium sp. OZ121 TaxID=3444183 RepID=UPI003F7B02FC
MASGDAPCQHVDHGPADHRLADRWPALIITGQPPIGHQSSQRPLHASAYARAAITAAEYDAKGERIDRWVELRATRQGILAGDDPPRLLSIIDESVVRRQIGGAVCLATQLEELARHAVRPNIEIRVLPFSAGAPASPSGAFRILTMEEPFPEVGYAETPKGAIYI